MENELVRSFDRVFIDEASHGSELAERASAIFPAENVEWVRARPFPEAQGRLTSREFERSKRQLYITRFEGAFFKPCPGASNVACCNYYVLNLGQQCNMNCSYCYLQSYLNSPLLTLYSNVEDAIGELRELSTKSREQPVRVGTGEVMDSLSLDRLTGHSKALIEFFRAVPKWTLEFKTKSAAVDQFLDVQHESNVTVSWSINPQYIISREEHGTATLDQRLEAARKCLDHGFKVAFHLDPMIWHPEWRENYGGLIDRIAAAFQPVEIPRISLGALRFQPDQRNMMRDRFGMESLVLQGEMFKSRDGKLRYDQRLRNEMFSFVIARFRDHDPKWKVWLCMESPESWISNYQAMPRQIPELEDIFRPLPKPPAIAGFSQTGGLV